MMAHDMCILYTDTYGGCSKTLVLFFISRVRSTGFWDQFLGARKTRESAAKGRRKVFIRT